MEPSNPQNSLDEVEIGQEAGPILIQIGSLLLSSGANTERTRITTSRIAEALGLQSEVFITHQTIQLFLSHKKQESIYHQLKRPFSYTNNFTLLSGISRMSWKIAEEKWTLNQIKSELTRLQSLTPYPRWLIVMAVAVAGAAFCRLFGGAPAAMMATFVATIIGQLTHLQAKHLKFNPYLSVYMASLMASLVSLFFIKLVVGIDREHLLSASLIFLIPGVPLINSFSDFIDGNILNGLLRTINGLLIVFSIALGLMAALLVMPVA